jgi:hypothetical protein
MSLTGTAKANVHKLRVILKGEDIIEVCKLVRM